MLKIKKSDYYKKHPDFRSVWNTERWDLPNWKEDRKQYIGKRTMMSNENGSAVLLIEGISFEIVEG